MPIFSSSWRLFDSHFSKDMPYLREHAVASMQVDADEWCAFINHGALMPQSFTSKLKELGYSDHRIRLITLTFIKDLHPERFNQRTTGKFDNNNLH